jgi:hypothetical protein
VSSTRQTAPNCAVLTPEIDGVVDSVTGGAFWTPVSPVAPGLDLPEVVYAKLPKRKTPWKFIDPPIVNNPAESIRK